jgi:hypothetical protein
MNTNTTLNTATRNPRKGDTMCLYGRHRVIISDVRLITGGFACDVIKHPDETDWPWTVRSATINSDYLTHIR